MRTLVSLFIATAVSLASFTLLAQPPQGGGKGGGCNYCHDSAQGASKASDANPKKLTARMMISMAKEINGKFPDGKDHVTCYTCHRGSTMPLAAAP